jgi:hypothetical protein
VVISGSVEPRDVPALELSGHWNSPQALLGEGMSGRKGQRNGGRRYLTHAHGLTVAQAHRHLVANTVHGSSGTPLD